MERKMASVQQVDSVLPIEGADAIECAKVGGWSVVVKKGEYQAGDKAIYFEIDSWIPHTLAPFLTKAGQFPKVYEGVEGQRLKTIRLRGQISQGLLLPLSVLGEAAGAFVGDDLTEVLGIKKWEPEEYAGTSMNAKGVFPYFIKKTDQERVQNLRGELTSAQGMSFERTIKRDGSSCTAYVYGDTSGVCSRNIELKEDDTNAFWAIIKENNILDKIRATGRNLAVQGELIAPNIQKNYENVRKPEFHCFSVWDIDKQEYLLPADRRMLCEQVGIPHITVVDEDFVLNHTCEELLALADAPGVNEGVMREGDVYKSNNSQFSFKVVSNNYLLKKG